MVQPSVGNSVFQFVKKYSLYLNRFEVLITAGFQITSSPQDFMSGSEIYELESTYDEIVSSITPLKGQEAFY